MSQFPYLDQFRARVAPPSNPVFGTRTWGQVFAELGTALPPDFVAFADIYGTSAFGNDYLFVNDPRDWGERTYDQAMRDQGDRYRNLYPDAAAPRWGTALPVWPEPGGFLSWGSDVDGNVYGWLTHGEPEQLPTAAWGRQIPDGVIDQVPMTQFLHGWLTIPVTYPQCFPPPPGLVDDERPRRQRRTQTPRSPRTHLPQPARGVTATPRAICSRRGRVDRPPAPPAPANRTAASTPPSNGLRRWIPRPPHTSQQAPLTMHPGHEKSSAVGATPT